MASEINNHQLAAVRKFADALNDIENENLYLREYHDLDGMMIGYVLGHRGRIEGWVTAARVVYDEDAEQWTVR